MGIDSPTITGASIPGLCFLLLSDSAALRMMNDSHLAEDVNAKRVPRAVERLREKFAKRGITAGAAGLAVSISANAVQAAPAGFGVAVSSSAMVSTVFSVSRVFAMTITKKALVAAVVALITGSLIYQAAFRSPPIGTEVPPAMSIEQRVREGNSLVERMAMTREPVDRRDVNFGKFERMLPAAEPLKNVRYPLFQKWAGVDPVAAANYPINVRDRLYPSLAGAIVNGSSFRNRSEIIDFVSRFPEGPYFDTAAVHASMSYTQGGGGDIRAGSEIPRPGTACGSSQTCGATPDASGQPMTD